MATERRLTVESRIREEPMSVREVTFAVVTVTPLPDDRTPSGKWLHDPLVSTRQVERAIGDVLS